MHTINSMQIRVGTVVDAIAPGLQPGSGAVASGVGVSVVPEKWGFRVRPTSALLCPLIY